jgi:mannose-6-phosphate isomerase
MTEYKKGAQPVFPEPESVGPRPWGEEELLVLVPGKYMLKRLTVKAGNKGGFQYHRLKDECGTVISGEMIIRYDDGEGGITERIVKSGDSFHFPPGIVHQEEALTDCIIIEGSTPHFNDRVRAEEFYGLVAEEGLPTTQLDEIEIK